MYYYLLNPSEWRLFVVTLSLAGVVVFTVFLALGDQTYSAYIDPLERLTHVELRDGFPDTAFIVAHKVSFDPYEPEYDMLNDFAFVAKHPCWVDEDTGQTWFLFRPRLTSIERREVFVNTKECVDPTVPSTCDTESTTIMKIVVSKFKLPFKVTPETVEMRVPSTSDVEAYAEYMQVQDSRWHFSGEWRSWPPLNIRTENRTAAWTCLHPADIPYPSSLARFVLFRGSVMQFQNFTPEDPFGNNIGQRRLETGPVASWPASSFFILPVVDNLQAPESDGSPEAQFRKMCALVEENVSEWGDVPVFKNAPDMWKPIPLRELKNSIQASFPDGTWVGKSTALGVQKLRLSSFKKKNHMSHVVSHRLRMELEYDPDSLPDWDNAYENGHANNDNHYYGLDSKGESHWVPGGRGRLHGYATPLELRADLREWVTDQVVTMTVLNFLSQLLSTLTGVKALIMLIFPTVLTLPLIFKPLGPLKYCYLDRSRGNRAQLLRLLLEEPLPPDEIELSDIGNGHSEEWPGSSSPRHNTKRSTVRDERVEQSEDAVQPKTGLIEQQPEDVGGSMLPAPMGVSDTIRMYWYKSNSNQSRRQ